MALPLLLPQEAVLAGLPEGSVLIDLSKPQNHAQYPVAGAIALEYGRIVRNQRPTGGLLPTVETIGQVLGELGIDNDTHVVAMDDEGGANACRLLWTLACVGHQNYSLLDGGLIAWVNEGRPLARNLSQPTPTSYQAELDTAPIADAEFILAHLEDPDWQWVDARSAQEYHGLSRSAQREGHIPGAKHWEFSRALDQTRTMRLLPEDQMRESLSDAGIDSSRPAVAYCLTHHRSSLVWFVLKLLGFPEAKGYPGAWSDWGNRTDTPVEV